MNWRILHGDVREQLRSLPDGSVQTCVTSPPYFGLRDYGMPGQIGMESSPETFVDVMVGVFREVRRVLADDGTLWLNIGDSYAGSGRGVNGDGTPGKITSAKQRSNAGAILDLHDKRVAAGAIGRQWVAAPEGYKQKDLIGVPWLLAFALRADGWYLRSDIIWSKPNPMPESVTDRPTKAHEYIFLLSKAARYYYNAEAIAESATRADTSPQSIGRLGQGGEQFKSARRVREDFDGTRNKRSVWHVATQPYPEAHFATYPEKLIEPCILAGSRVGDTVLDPFTGSGTTGAVAIRHGRSFIGCELNPEYVQLARRRIGGEAPLFAEERTA